MPVEIGQLSNLQSLNLSYNQLSQLPTELVQLSSLQSLNLSWTQLSQIPTEIGELANLQSLSLSGNKLSHLPTEIRHLNNLQSLSLSGNQLSQLPPEIGQLRNLQSLNLINNLLSQLPKEIGQLTNLQSLSLSGNQLSQLLPEIGQLRNLQSLNLINNLLSQLPKEIGQLSNLQSLNLINNQLSQLPAQIGQLSNLQSLELRANQLSQLPAEIEQLRNLQSLDLQKNRLSQLPAEIGQLRNLQSLDLQKNRLSQLPAEIGQLRNLQSLDLQKNRLSQLPVEIGQLRNLESLDLTENQLRKLPVEIGQLRNLESLDLTENQLRKLPVEIGQLRNLQSLDLQKNRLSQLPVEIRQLRKLQSLNLYNNQLSQLPAEIGQLSDLQSLNLYNNQLSQIPFEIQQLSHLKKLDLRANPLPIRPEVLGAKEYSKNSGDVNEILDLYFQIFPPQKTESLYEAKLLIVGEGEVGKTSLARKIWDDKYELQDEQSTEGINVISWEFPLSKNNTFRVNIWDFGGQEIYHQTHQFFLTERSLYALVVDTRRENTNLNWWLKVVELLSDNSPVLLIKNEKEDRQCEINERQLKGEFSNLRNIFATNLATNRGLEEIKTEIAREIQRLPHVGHPLPKIWVSIRAALENLPRDYITDHEYFKLCEINGITERKEMLQLSRYFHDLGVCLHFQKDPVLKHWFILKPEWGTGAVYKVLDNKKVRDDFGRFTLDDVKNIWHEDEYANMRDELMQLMLNFKVCYEIPGTPHHYIAPHLLSTDKAEYGWNEENNLILRYEYDFMPKGILTRFIVEMHRYIEKQKLVWKGGVVLGNDDGRAEIIETYRPSKGEIKIRATGFDKKALMTVVRRKFSEIHDSYERLRYQTLIPCNCSVCKDKTPEEFRFNTLRKFLMDGQSEIQCRRSYKSINIRSLLDDVNFSTDPRGEYKPPEEDHDEPKSSSKPPTRDQVFISYSHEDKDWLNQLQTHLKPMIEKKSVSTLG